jgi:hypothetical protein
LVSWEVVEATNSEGISVLSTVPEIVVFAWQYHLDKIIEVEATVFINVEESDEIIAFAFSGGEYTVISQEV